VIAGVETHGVRLGKHSPDMKMHAVRLYIIVSQTFFKPDIFVVYPAKSAANCEVMLKIHPPVNFCIVIHDIVY
jgi:hypothetical protein